MELSGHLLFCRYIAYVRAFRKTLFSPQLYLARTLISLLLPVLFTVTPAYAASNINGFSPLHGLLTAYGDVEVTASPFVITSTGRLTIENAKLTNTGGTTTRASSSSLRAVPTTSPRYPHEHRELHTPQRLHLQRDRRGNGEPQRRGHSRTTPPLPTRRGIPRRTRARSKTGERSTTWGRSQTASAGPSATTPEPPSPTTLPSRAAAPSRTREPSTVRAPSPTPAPWSSPPAVPTTSPAVPSRTPGTSYSAATSPSTGPTGER